jgi:hypothetical protein
MFWLSGLAERKATFILYDSIDLILLKGNSAIIDFISSGVLTITDTLYPKAFSS